MGVGPPSRRVALSIRCGVDRPGPGPGRRRTAGRSRVSAASLGSTISPGSRNCGKARSSEHSVLPPFVGLKPLWFNVRPGPERSLAHQRGHARALCAPRSLEPHHRGFPPQPCDFERNVGEASSPSPPQRRNGLRLQRRGLRPQRSQRFEPFRPSRPHSTSTSTQRRNRFRRSPSTPFRPRSTSEMLRPRWLQRGSSTSTVTSRPSTTTRRNATATQSEPLRSASGFESHSASSRNVGAASLGRPRCRPRNVGAASTPQRRSGLAGAASLPSPQRRSSFDALVPATSELEFDRDVGDFDRKLRSSFATFRLRPRNDRATSERHGCRPISTNTATSELGGAKRSEPISAATSELGRRPIRSR